MFYFLQSLIFWFEERWHLLHRYFARFRNSGRDFKFAMLLVFLNLSLLFAILFFLTPIRY